MTELSVESVQVNLFCADVEACARFYEALGLRRAFVTPPTGTPTKIEVEAAGVRIGFDAVTAANEIAALDVVAPTERSAEVALWVDDVDGFYDRALGAGAGAIRPPMDSPDGRLRYAWVAGPEGHQLRFLRKR